jgi:hypothetical protein
MKVTVFRRWPWQRQDEFRGEEISVEISAFGVLTVKHGSDVRTYNTRSWSKVTSGKD